MTTPERATFPPSTPGAALEIASELRSVIGSSLKWLAPLSDAQTSRRPRPGAWSPREIIGHLIDSASNNHGRFVRAALDDTLVFPGYDQDAWVALHRYHEQDWQALLARWGAFNEQVAVAVEQLPGDALARPRREHNLDRIAWQVVAADVPTTLEYFVRDYIGHLRHHLARIAATVDAEHRERARGR